MKNLKSKKYLLAAGTGQGRGTFLIVRRADNLSTLRFVCNEALETYKKLARAYRTKRAMFDKMCAQYQFTS